MDDHGEDRVYISEINATLNSEKIGEEVLYSKISVTPPQGFRVSRAPRVLEIDEDGDLVRDDGDDVILQIEHSPLSDSLCKVGSQIWGGSLVLCDFVLNNRVLKGKVLEIGSGTGILAVAASLLPSNSFSTYYATDLPSNLPLIRRNIRANDAQEDNFIVLPLDLKTNPLPEWLSDIDIVLAGDIIYDDSLTDAVVNNLLNFFVEKSRNRGLVLYFGIEKRYVFTTKDLDVIPHSYQHFLKRLVSNSVDFEEVDLPKQSFCYHRSEDLVLIKVTL